jgi:hypothetical protein
MHELAVGLGKEAEQRSRRSPVFTLMAQLRPL